VGTAASVAVLGLAGCGSSHSSGFDNSNGGLNLSGSSGGGSLGSGANSSGGGAITGDGGSGVIQAIIRDFRFYDANDSTTVADFENPPYTLDANGNPVAGGGMYSGPWDDRNIVTDTIGSDQKPVYKNASGTTLTTHGKSSFDKWYNDTSGTNIRVIYPLPLSQNPDGSYGYDSNVSGVTYGSATGQSGKGFFPIDDGSPYQTMFGDQGKTHNYSFTVEIHTVFTYQGGETFNFRGDDDVFVYIDGKLVINLGGIHGPETASVTVDSLGLTKGKTYPLDFFSAERHVTGSNIEFTTTLQLVAVPPPK
jgi:fibro-slime domain-containing protein